MSTTTRIELPSAGDLIEQPMWIAGATPFFAVYHPPAEARRQSKAVLVCAPFGWHDMAGYTARRIWAQRLAKAGHPVLRFDLPGTGQSAGGPGDGNLVPTWLQAIDVAARWLSDRGGASSVTVIGIGLGALLALEASTDERTRFDELVLWNLPDSGKAITREMRLFGAGVRLVTRQAAVERRGPSLAPGLPKGWIDCSGHTVSAETVAALEALPDEKVPSARVGRVLLLERDAEQPTRNGLAFADRLRADGIATDVASGSGYAAMHVSPHLALVPDEAIATVSAWLGRDVPASTAAEHVGAPADAATDVEVAEGVRESAFAVAQPSGTLFGVLAESDDATERAATDLCIVCLPAMAQRCIGPSRVWVELARRQAARGVPVLRVDLASVGESAGPPDAVRDGMAFALDPDRTAQVTHVLDALQDRLGSRRFILAGLSSAGYLAEEAGYVDERVVGVLSLNPLPTPGNDIGLKFVATSLLCGTWRRVLIGDVHWRRWGDWARRRIRDRARCAVRSLRRRSDVNQETPQPHSYADLLEALQRRQGLLTVGVAEGEPAGWFLEQSGIARDRDLWPALRLHRFLSSDHELRPLDDQRAAHGLADDMVVELLRTATRSDVATPQPV